MADLASNTPPPPRARRRARRLSRLPAILMTTTALIVGGVLLFGILSRGPTSSGRSGVDEDGRVLSSDEEVRRLTAGYGDGVIPALDEVDGFEPAVLSFSPEIARPSPTPILPVEPVASEEEKDFDAELRERVRRELLELEAEREVDRARSVYERDRAARSSVTALRVGGMESGLLGASRSTDALEPSGGDARERRAASALDPARSFGASQIEGDTDPNLQGRKEAFLQTAGLDTEDYLARAIQDPLSTYELKQGSIIPGVMITGVNSDLPGRIIGQVSQDVYDSATGRHLLIPQGTRLFGRYDSRIAFGQGRLLVAWTRLIFPDGSAIAIEGMPGADQAGHGGFADQVDNHYLRIYGSAILLSLLGGGLDALRGGFGDGDDSDLARSIRERFADNFGQVANRTIERNLDIQPTLVIRPGYRFTVMVEQDMVLRPYRG